MIRVYQSRARPPAPAAERRLWLGAVSVTLLLAGSRFALLSTSGVPIPWIPATGELLGLSLFCLGCGAYYLLARREVALAAPLLGLGMVMAALIGSGEASDLAFYFGRTRPLADDALSAADQKFGFCWRCYAAWWDAHPTLFTISDLAYRSIIVQAPLIVVALAIHKRHSRLCALALSCQIALIFTSTIAAVFPALGAYTHYGLTAADHPHIDLMFSDDMRNTIAWLRTADFAAFPDGLTTGLISFPSFHGAMAVAYTWGAWPTLCRWPVAATNLVSLLITPVDGSHYMVDVAAGLAVGLLASLVATLLVEAFAGSRSADHLARVRREPALSG